MTRASLATTDTPPRWEWLLAGTVLFIFFCGMPFSYLLADGPIGADGGAGEEQPLARFTWLPVYAMILTLLLNRIRQVWALVTGNGLLAVTVGLTLLSASWSLYPSDTLRRFVALSVTTLFAFYLADRFRTVELLRLLSIGIMVAMGLSLVTAVAVPDWGTMSYGGANAWRGVFAHKNSFGLAMLLALIVFIYLFRADPTRRWMYGAALVLTVGLLFLSRSFTPVMVGMIVVPILFLLELNRRPSVFARAAATLAALAVGLAVLFLLLNLETFFQSAGRDFTLTGRTVIWILVWSFIQDSFWLGYGYQAFWLKGPNSPAASVWDNTEWEFQEAHNGYLELWLGLGVVGVGLFLLLFFKTLRNAVQHYRLSGSAASSWPVTFLVLFLCINLTESHILIQHDVVWLLFVSTALSLWKWKQSLVRVRQTAAWGARSPELGAVPM